MLRNLSSARIQVEMKWLLLQSICSYSVEKKEHVKFFGKVSKFSCNIRSYFTKYGKSLDFPIRVRRCTWFGYLNTKAPFGIYLFKGNNGNTTRTMCEICSKLPLKIPKDMKDVNDLVLVSLLLTLKELHTLLWCFQSCL